MPIVKKKSKPEKKYSRIGIETSIMEKVQQYCNWLNMKKPDEFFEQAAEYLLSKDKDWINYINSKETA